MVTVPPRVKPVLVQVEPSGNAKLPAGTAAQVGFRPDDSAVWNCPAGQVPPTTTPLNERFAPEAMFNPAEVKVLLSGNATVPVKVGLARVAKPGQLSW